MGRQVGGRDPSRLTAMGPTQWGIESLGYLGGWVAWYTACSQSFTRSQSSERNFLNQDYQIHYAENYTDKLHQSSPRHEYKLAGLNQGVVYARKKVKAGKNWNWYQVSRNLKCESPLPLYYKREYTSSLLDLSASHFLSVTQDVHSSLVKQIIILTVSNSLSLCCHSVSHTSNNQSNLKLAASPQGVGCVGTKSSRASYTGLGIQCFLNTEEYFLHFS